MHRERERERDRRLFLYVLHTDAKVKEINEFGTGDVEEDYELLNAWNKVYRLS